MEIWIPNIHLDSGTVNSCWHGEVFVTDDGAEADLYMEHDERFIDENLTRANHVTSGRGIIRSSRKNGVRVSGGNDSGDSTDPRMPGAYMRCPC